MKKVAILTQPLTNNYGGILQNFALQTVLQRRGYDPVTLNICRPTEKMKFNLHWVLSVIKRSVQKYLFRNKKIVYVNAVKQVNWGNTPQKYQQRFMDRYINIEQLGPEALTEGNDNYDVYIVGSDQVWRPCFTSGLLTNYYLDFVKNDEAKRIAYAASFGVDCWETKAADTKVITSLVQKFDGISVREQSGVDLCRKYLNVNAVTVLDPTMLLNADDYRHIYSEYENYETNERYIAAYVLDQDVKNRWIINRISRQMGLPVKFIGSYSKQGFDSIESWLAGIDKAAYVITDSFHGSVFSILFNKQFVALGNESRGMSRFEGLFAEFSIKERLVSSSIDAIKALKNKIDYGKVDEVLNEKRRFAYDFLSKYIIL